MVSKLNTGIGVMTYKMYTIMRHPPNENSSNRRIPRYNARWKLTKMSFYAIGSILICVRKQLNEAGEKYIISFIWVPGHSKIEEDEEVNIPARKSA